MNPRRWVALLAFLGLTAAFVYGQGRRNFGFDRDLGYTAENEPPNTEFIFARWHYGTGPYRGGGWAHDYPTAEEHILQIMKEATLVDVQKMSYRVVELSSPEIFKYPFSYVSEPGEMDLTEEEVVNLREYINRGGFVMVDDFGGQGGGDREMQAFRRNLLRAFPERDMFEITDEHELLRNFYNIDSIQTMHPMTGVKSIFYGYPADERGGGLSMVICFNNDVGDYWEFIDEPRYPVRPAAEALKLGINFVIYSMTH